MIHTNGIHLVAVDFCECALYHNGRSGLWRTQPLRMEWYPATHLEPQTVCTFRVLENFHAMTLQGKVTMYDYYSGLEKLTDNTGIAKPKVWIPRNHRKSDMGTG